MAMVMVVMAMVMVVTDREVAVAMARGRWWPLALVCYGGLPVQAPHLPDSDTVSRFGSRLTF